MNSTEPLLLEQTGGVLRLTLNRPDKRNSLSLGLLEKLEQTLEKIADNPEIRVVVLGGNGPAFCAGHDLSEMTGRTADEYKMLFRTCSDVMLAIQELPQPVIARVHGIATAAGCQLVAACDLAVATEEAKFATPGVKIGLFCTTPMVPLVRAIPEKAAMEMLLTGQPISAHRACELGLVNRVTTADQLDATIAQFCDAICQSSPLPIRIGKQAFYRQQALSAEQAYRDAVEVMTENVMCHDAQEGMSAFLQKRAPEWTGR